MVEKSSPLTTYRPKVGVKEDISGYLGSEGKCINTKKSPDFSVFFLICAFLKYPEEKVVRPRFIVQLFLFDFL